jgi:hypothetical protein
LVAIAATLLAATMVSCSSDGGSSAPDQIEHPGGDAVVLRIESVGGLLPADQQQMARPAFLMVGDGRVFVTFPVAAIYPGPAMVPFHVRRLNESGIQRVLQRVASTGLFGESHVYRSSAPVMDAGSTVFTLRAGGKEVTVTVDVLGINFVDPPRGMTAEEVGVRRMFDELASWLDGLERVLPADSWVDVGWHEHRPDALRLVVRNADADPLGEGGLDVELANWPLRDDAATFGHPLDLPGSRCAVVTGNDADAWLAVLAAASQITRFTQDGHKYAVDARPLLPGEQRTCPRGA